MGRVWVWKKSRIESNSGLIFVSYMIWGESFTVPKPFTLMEDDNCYHEGGRDDLEEMQLCQATRKGLSMWLGQGLLICPGAPVEGRLPAVSRGAVKAAGAES